jgi:hypothetical protein
VSTIEGVERARPFATLTTMLTHSVPVVAVMVALSLPVSTGQQAAAPGSAAEAGWTQLFNGKDFTGWRLSKPESFKVENGAIAANGRASHAYYDGPFLGHTFRNFELKVDVLVKANATGGSNGGVYILTEFEEKGGNVRASGDFPSKGFEIQVNNAYARDQVKTGSLYHVVDITESPVKDDEWFTFHIVVKDQTITVKVNEQQTVSWTQPADWNGGREGPGRTITAQGGTIALQAHDANSVVYYKNIRIKPLT